LFLVVGFGADVLFVVTDYWYDSWLVCDDRVGRLAWTYRRALPATFATTATTSLSFLANLISSSRALREFGLFMGISVLVSWVLMLLIYAPLCVLDAEYLGNIRLVSLREAKAVAEGRKSKYYGKWTSHLYSWRRFYLILSTIILAILLGYAIPNVKEGSGLNLYPERHNQNHGTLVLREFADESDYFRSNMLAPPSTARICNHTTRWAGEECDLHWCEADASVTNLSGCSCFERDVNVSECSTSLQQPNGLLHILGPVETEATFDAIHSYIQVQSGGFANGPVLDPTAMPPLVLQEWASGISDVAQWQQSRFSTHPNPSASQGTCPVEYMCYCRTASTCQMDAQKWRQLPQLPIPRRRLAATWRVPVNQQDSIGVMFGMKASTATSLIGTRAQRFWSFDESFTLSDPWKQREMLRFCEEVPKEKQLLISKSWCWMSEFAKNAQRNGLRFPLLSSSFDAAAYSFISAGTYHGDHFVFIEDSKVKALFYQFRVDLNKANPSSERAFELKNKWDEVINDWHAAVAAFEKTIEAFDVDPRRDHDPWDVRGAFHFSTSWQTVERQNAATESLIVTSVVILSLAFLSMFVFTQSFILSLFVLLSTAGILAGLIFFIVAMSWSIGFIEVIAIVYFAGYAVTYSLHIAHKYSSAEAVAVRSEEPTMPIPSDRNSTWQSPWPLALLSLTIDETASIRIQRTFFAFTSIGWATIGSAVTTAGSSFFLIPCTLVLFQKLGSMCLVVVLISVITAQVALPVMLMMCGPIRPGICIWAKRKKPATSSHEEEYTSPRAPSPDTSSPEELFPQEWFDNEQRPSETVSPSKNQRMMLEIPEVEAHERAESIGCCAVGSSL